MNSKKFHASKIQHDKKSSGFPDFIVRYPKNRGPEKEKSDPKPPKPQN